jgi:uncharacterized alpha-E superfamily protein
MKTVTTIRSLESQLEEVRRQLSELNHNITNERDDTKHRQLTFENKRTELEVIIISFPHVHRHHIHHVVWLW